MTTRGAGRGSRVAAQIARLCSAFSCAEPEHITITLHPDRRHLWRSISVGRREVHDDASVEQFLDLFRKLGQFGSPDRVGCR